MKTRTIQQKRLAAAAFAGLFALLALLLWQGVRRGDAVRVGIPRTAAAYGAGMLLQTPTAQYACSLGSTPAAVRSALAAGEIDAALLPYELAADMPGCAIRAVLGYADAVIVSGDPAIRNLDSLRGKTVTLAESLRGSRAEAMLRTLLRQSSLRCDIVYGDGAADIRCCGIDAAEALLRADTGLRICFSLAREWRALLPSVPPAGLCLAVRQDYLESAGGDYAAFEKALENAMAYAREKRKKTAAMAAACGLAPDEETADLLYDFCDFRYLTGAEMNASLNAL